MSMTPWQTRFVAPVIIPATHMSALAALDPPARMQHRISGVGCPPDMLLTRPAGCQLQMMDRLGESAKLETPEDTSITTLFIGSITPSMSEEEIVEPFLPFGEVRVGWSYVHTLGFSAFQCFARRSCFTKSSALWMSGDLVSAMGLTKCWFGHADPVGAEAGGAALHVRDLR